ncbi:MAG: peptidylprolyl isomerase [Myxococcales bacterium]|nr:peptidylprolyl isomerase [Myxococcales bacterium]
MRARVLDDMVNEELILQAADKAELDVDPAEIDAHIADIKTQYELDDAALEDELRKQGQSMAGFRNDTRKQLLRYRAINQQVKPKIDITEADVRARYDQMARRADSVAAVFVAHILVAVAENATVSEREVAKAKAVAIKKRLDAGEPFKTVAAETSDDAATKASGGELGWFERGTLAWDSIVFEMKVGETSDPVAGPQGFHLLRVNDKKTSAAGDYDQVKVSIKNDMWRREVEKKTSEWIEELRRDAYIDIK